MKTLILLTLLHAGAAGADAYWTHQNAVMPKFHEANPIARTFVRSTEGCVTYFSVDVGLHFAGALMLHKHQHDRLAKALLIEGIADNGIGAANSAHGLGTAR